MEEHDLLVWANKIRGSITDTEKHSEQDEEEDLQHRVVVLLQQRHRQIVVNRDTEEYCKRAKEHVSEYRLPMTLAEADDDAFGLASLRVEGVVQARRQRSSDRGDSAQCRDQ